MSIRAVRDWSSLVGATVGVLCGHGVACARARHPLMAAASPEKPLALWLAAAELTAAGKPETVLSEWLAQGSTDPAHLDRCLQ